MASDTVHVGPFSAVYVGVFGASDVLTQITIDTTDVQTIEWEMPEVVNYFLRNSVQTGPQRIAASLTFLSDDPNVVKLANGNFVTTTNQDDASTFAKYVLLLIHTDEEAESSILIPECYTLKSLRYSNSKNDATKTPLTFQWVEPDKDTKIYYKRSASDLASILGARSPI